jgi:DNA-binding IclR family transcriptional regulator
MGELGAIARERVDVVKTCSSVLDALAEATRETVMLATPDWESLELTVVGSRMSPLTLAVSPRVGVRHELAAGAVGKALLLALAQTERRTVIDRLPLRPMTDRTPVSADALAAELVAREEEGFVIADREYADGVSAVGVPVLVEGGRPRAAIAVVGPTTRLGGSLDRLGGLLLDATAGLRAS